VATQQLNEDRDSAGLDNNLCLLSGTGCNVCQSPSSFKLYESMGRSEELNKTANNTGLDNFLDGWVSFFRKELSEFGSGLNLQVDLFGENAFDHLWEIFVQLFQQETSQHFDQRINPAGETDSEMRMLLSFIELWRY
jgi:hypothetical protein